MELAPNYNLPNHSAHDSDLLNGINAAEPGFFWLAIMILLPVVYLMVFRWRIRRQRQHRGNESE